MCRFTIAPYIKCTIWETSLNSCSAQPTTQKECVLNRTKATICLRHKQVVYTKILVEKTGSLGLQTNEIHIRISKLPTNLSQIIFQWLNMYRAHLTSFGTMFLIGSFKIKRNQPVSGFYNPFKLCLIDHGFVRSEADQKALI